ncbi:hypothetical protein MNEG_0792 [Monoraphidium neglectum]|uniref:Uncharacterized protein n=1 Tax=Monoraphidium neglectum TaxID=145388 RepID=A0A0D2KA77_9CHLO|nr:hypothetical protein MNEG_0792 [Monoraphidium neglectum]KIZ07163.1 hypothetical protein MNEG_0792 [Monoraphidium neglectum]|eukprot:XP_013906182.1 hypothetical protein MNEG_0792 [Monoraphidium neglectum]
MEQLKQLVAAQAVRNKHLPKEATHKDKLEQTKLAERAQKEAAKAEREKHKVEKEEERLAKAAAERIDRAYFHPDSKRTQKDERKHRDKEAHEATGDYCEHGVWRCRICHPVTKHK